MTLQELKAELEKIDQDVLRVRRADYLIGGDPVFATGLRQHIVLSLGEIRQSLDKLVLSLDHVDDLDKVVGLRARIMDSVRKAIGPGKEDDAG